MTPARSGLDAAPRFGIGPNLAQFSLLVAVNGLVGGMLGQERTVLPLLATRTFGITALSAALTFIAAFGILKAATNLFAGALSDRYGRKPVLVAGWLIGLPVPLMIIWAPSWSWVIIANLLLGVNQGLTWSTTVIMKIDLAGPSKRGTAMGINEAAGYGMLAVTALATGAIAERWGLRPGPFLLGLAYAALGLGLSCVWVRETRPHARHEAVLESGLPSPGVQLSPQADPSAHPPQERGAPPPRPAVLTPGEVFRLTSFRDKALSSVSQAGLVNNLNDGLAWGLFPLHFAGVGLPVGQIGILAATYPAVWGMGQLLTGVASDRLGRKWLIAAGMWTQALAIGLVALTSGFAPWLLAVGLLGVGTAMVYPTLLAAVADVSHPAWRASSVGVYRLWRDSGFAAGALFAGLVADAVDVPTAILAVGALTAASGVVVAVRMYETHRPGPALLVPEQTRRGRPRPSGLD